MRTSVHGIFQAGVLEWGAIAFSNPILPWTRSMKSIIFENNPNDYTISHGREILEVFLEVSINGDLKKSKKPQMKSFVSQGTLKNIVAFLVAQMVKTACNTGNLGSIPGLRRLPGEGNGNPFQCSCLENSMTEKPGGLQSIGLKTVRHD